MQISGGVETITITDAEPGTRLRIDDAKGEPIATVLVDEAGNAHLAFAPGSHRVLETIDDLVAALADGQPVPPGSYTLFDVTDGSEELAGTVQVLDVDDVGVQRLHVRQQPGERSGTVRHAHHDRQVATGDGETVAVEGDGCLAVARRLEADGFGDECALLIHREGPADLAVLWHRKLDPVDRVRGEVPEVDGLVEGVAGHTSAAACEVIRVDPELVHELLGVWLLELTHRPGAGDLGHRGGHLAVGVERGRCHVARGGHVVEVVPDQRSDGWVGAEPAR